MRKVSRFVVAYVAVIFLVTNIGCTQNSVGPTPIPIPNPTPEVEPTPVDLPNVFHRLLDGAGNSTPVTVRINWVKPALGSRVTPGPLRFGYQVDTCANNACFGVEAQVCMDELPPGRVDTRRTVVSYWSEDGIRPYSGGGYQRWTAGIGGVVSAGSCFSITRSNDIHNSNGLIGFAPDGGSRYLLVVAAGMGRIDLDNWEDSLGRYAYHTDYR